MWAPDSILQTIRRCLQLLGLTGKDSYHLCDIMDVYDDLRADAPAEGFSSEVLQGRLEVLELVKDRAVYQGGRVALADKGGMVLPVQLLPSALVLLMQVGAGRRCGARVWRLGRARGGWVDSITSCGPVDLVAQRSFKPLGPIHTDFLISPLPPLRCTHAARSAPQTW